MSDFENKEFVEPVEDEKVNHPSHYNREDGIECIEEMIIVFGKTAVMNFCLCNAWKYRYRSAEKNGEIDLKKSDWYMKKYRQLKEEIDADFDKKFKISGKTESIYRAANFD